MTWQVFFCLGRIAAGVPATQKYKSQLAKSNRDLHVEGTTLNFSQCTWMVDYETPAAFFVPRVLCCSPLGAGI